MLFLPWAVVKFAIGHVHARLLRREIANQRHARANPFWAELTGPMLSLAGRAAVSPRYRYVEPSDRAALSRILGARLEAARGAPVAPTLPFVARGGLFAALPESQRRRIEAALRPLALPATGMHGDCHLANFCRRGDGYVLLDWEHYDPSGSFAYDYMDYHIAQQWAGRGAGLRDYLERAVDPDPAAEAAARALGVSARALWLYYHMVKGEIAVERAGGIGRLSEAKRRVLLPGLERRIERLLDAIQRPRAPIEARRVASGWG